MVYCIVVHKMFIFFASKQAVDSYVCLQNITFWYELWLFINSNISHMISEKTIQTKELNLFVWSKNII